MSQISAEMNDAANPKAKPGDFIVYAAPKGEFKGWGIPVLAQLDVMDVHQAIAEAETAREDIHYAAAIRPGSFNAMVVRHAQNFDDAVRRAREAGLKFEPLNEVFRHNDLPRAGAKPPFFVFVQETFRLNDFTFSFRSGFDLH